jgi:hypothetical protein
VWAAALAILAVGVLVTACGARTDTVLGNGGVFATDSGAPAEQDSGEAPESGPEPAPEAGPDANVTCTPPMLLSMGVNGSLMLASYSEACSNGTYRVDIQCANGSAITCTGPGGMFNVFSPDDLCSADSGAESEAFGDCGYPQ